MDIENHIGVAVIDACIVEVIALLLCRAVDANHQEVHLLALKLLGGVDELIELDAAALRGDGPHDESERTAENQRDDQQRDEQDLPPADSLLFLAALAVAAFFAALFAAGLTLARGFGCVMAARGLMAAAAAACGGLGLAGRLRGLGARGAAGLRGSLLHLDAACGCIVVVHRLAALYPVQVHLAHLRAGRGGGPPVCGLLIQAVSGLPGLLLGIGRAVDRAAGALHLNCKGIAVLRSAAAR